VSDRGQFQPKYTPEERETVLAKLAANGGNVARTSRETGIREATIRRWRDGKRPPKDAAGAKAPVESRDLKRFSKDSWRIIHKANEVVEEKVDELGARDAASIAAGYFDRQSKAEEQMSQDSDGSEEYVAKWDGEDK